ncbi:MAG: hypothetical protein BYD32DRAFT_423942 [Podila humilis]|nr:MAG: hypothetical protein BYD32DRAFT_423942 [Podila humilis]
MDHLPPELIYRVGWFVSPWVSSKEGHRDLFEFRPKDLLACIAVNRTWHRTLSSLLWMTYCDTPGTPWGASTSVRWGDWDVPSTTVVTYSRYFRYLSLHLPWTGNALHSTHLRELVVSNSALRSCIDLVSDNPQLTLLSLEFDGDDVYDDLHSAFDSLTRLKSLCLNRCSFRSSTDQFISFVGDNPVLKHLSLTDLTGLTRFQEHPAFECLTHLVLDCSWNSNPGIVHLIRLCPHLESLTFQPDISCPATNLSKAIRESCPRLISISCTEIYRHFLEPIMGDNRILLLIQAIPRLVHFDMAINNFSWTICQTLLGVNSGWLETVHLYHDRGNKEGCRNASRILATCSNLRSFILFHRSIVEMTEDVQALFDLPWNCPLLERIELVGFQSYDDATDDDDNGSETQSESSEAPAIGLGRSTGGPGGWDGEDSFGGPSTDPEDRSESIRYEPRSRAHTEASDHDFLNMLERHGWKDRFSGDAVQTITRAERALRDRLFERLVDLPSMKRIIVQECEYVRKTTTQT